MFKILGSTSSLRVKVGLRAMAKIEFILCYGSIFRQGGTNRQNTGSAAKLQRWNSLPSSTAYCGHSLTTSMFILSVLIT